MIDLTIPGWCNKEKLGMIKTLARNSTGSILELGTWMGRSLCCWAEHTNQQVVGVDFTTDFTLTTLKNKSPNAVAIMHGNIEMWDAWNGDINVVRTRIIEQKNLPNITDHLKSTDEFFEDNIGQFSIIYIDGSHDTAQVKTDITNSIMVLTAGGLICGDDYCWATVREAVAQSGFENNFSIIVNTKFDMWFCIFDNTDKKWIDLIIGSL